MQVYSYIFAFAGWQAECKFMPCYPYFFCRKCNILYTVQCTVYSIQYTLHWVGKLIFKKFSWNSFWSTMLILCLKLAQNPRMKGSLKFFCGQNHFCMKFINFLFLSKIIQLCTVHTAHVKKTFRLSISTKWLDVAAGFLYR